MSEWISKAANVFKRDVPETPQPFEVHCECGQQHSGLRRSRQQHLVCKDCGSSLFVLPRDTYPPPHVPKRPEKKRKRRLQARKPVSDTIDLAPEPVIGIPVVDSETDSKTNKRSKRLNDTDQDESAVEIEVRPNIIVRFYRAFIDTIIGFASAFKDFWTPYRKLALIIFCLLGLTAYYSIRQSQLRKAVNVVKEELDLGIEDLNSSNWVQARQHFEVATEAVDLLGREDLEANTIRQYLRETTALTRLTSISLLELMEIAEEYYTERGAEKWQQKFVQSYQDDWCIIEGYLRPVTDPSAVSAGYNLELIFPIFVGPRQRPVHVQLAFPQAENLPQVQRNDVYDTGDGTLAVFGAQVEKCFIGPNGEWILRMNPETSFFWVNRTTYEATHLHTGSITPLEDQDQMFRIQGTWMGVRQ